jgi:hypothetical protein
MGICHALPYVPNTVLFNPRLLKEGWEDKRSPVLSEKVCANGSDGANFTVNRTLRLASVSLVIRDRMLAKAATHILKPNLKSIIWPPSPPSITHFRWRNPLPLFSRRFCASSIPQNKSSLSPPCSFLHHSSIQVSPDMSSKKPLDHYRLPTDVRPKHYDLTIRTDLEKEKFSGYVRIECVCCYLCQV